MNKDKEYIVETPVDPVILTEEEKRLLRKKKVPPPDAKGYGRQNVFEDRRDHLANNKHKGPERRRSKTDRRDQESD